MANRGKRFEQEISKMLRNYSTIAYFFRPVDVPPTQRQRFMTTSPIDFYCYWQGGQGLVIECKAMKTKSLPFLRFSDEQWESLSKCWGGGVDTYVFVNFYGFDGRDGQRGHCYAVPFGKLQERKIHWQTCAEKPRKSWPLSDIVLIGEQLHKISGSWEW